MQVFKLVCSRVEKRNIKLILYGKSILFKTINPINGKTELANQMKLGTFYEAFLIKMK